MTLKDKTAIVGVGATPYYRAGQSLPQTPTEMACKAILLALDDAGLTIQDLDGFAIYSCACDPAVLGSILGVPEIRFAASLTSGGGGSAGSIGLAAAAIDGGMAEVCVIAHDPAAGQPPPGGTSTGDGEGGGGGGGNPYGAGGVAPSMAFTANAGLISPGHSFSVHHPTPHAPVRHQARAPRRGRDLAARRTRSAGRSRAPEASRSRSTTTSTRA